MKTKFSNALDCIHTFAQQSQNEGRSSNIFFNGKTIYSYGHHYELARIIDHVNGQFILINDKGYSNTTAKHIGQVTQATRQYRQYFTTNVDLYLVHNSITSNFAKLLKAKKPLMYINEILSKYESLISYPCFTTNDKKSVQFKAIQKIVNSINNPELIEKAKQADKLLKAKQAKKAANKLKQDVNDFYIYETDYIRANEDYIRVSQDNLFVESSQGVKVDINEAKLLYSFIQSGKDIKGHKIGNYTVISINGTLKIGCHNINIQSMHRTGKLLNN